MKLISGFLAAGCLAVGLVCASFAEMPDAWEFFDRASLGDSERTAAPIPNAAPREDRDVLLVWDNGGFITHPGAGVDGADVSMASADQNFAGDNVRQWEDNEFFRIADRFEIDVTTGVLQVSTFGYEPFEAPPTWSSGNLKIWSGMPGEPDSDVLFERNYNSLEFVFTGVYRIRHLEVFTDVRRPVFEIRWDLISAGDPLLWLEPGEYWLDWQVVGGLTGWSVYVMDANSEDPDQPSTVVGPARQLQPDGWAATEVGTPFQVFGVHDDLFHDRFEAVEAPGPATQYVAH